MKILSYLLFGIVVLLGIGSYLYTTRVDNRPKVFAGVIVEEYEGMVPLVLSSIDKWDYSKSKIAMEVHLISSDNDVKDMIEEWVKKNRSSYASLELVYERPIASTNASKLEINRVLGQIKDAFMTSSKQQNCDYCFITTSDTLLQPYTLSYLIEKKKPIIAPMLFPIPKQGDPFRNYFAAVSEIGYYKDDPQYFPIAKREVTGTFALPCIHTAYLIDTAHIDKLSFSKDFTDWEFIAFSKSARNSNTQQFLTNEREFGVFLHLDDKMSKEERKNYSIVNNAIKLSPEFIQQSLEPYIGQNPSLKKSAGAFASGHHNVMNLPDGGYLVVDDLNDAINKYILKQGYASEEHIANQFKKYAKEGSEAVIIGNRSDADSIVLSRIVGDRGTVHVWEPVEKAFIMQAINKKINGYKNITLNKSFAEKPLDKQKKDYLPMKKEGMDDLPLTNLSFVAISSKGSEIAAIRGGLNAINKYKPVIMAAIAEDGESKAKIDEIRSLGYIYTSIADDLYLFIPLGMAGLDTLSHEAPSKLRPPVTLKSKNVSDKSTSEKSDRPPIKVTWEGTFLDFMSLSNVNRGMTESLLEYPDISLNCLNIWTCCADFRKHPELIKMSQRLGKNNVNDRDITVRHLWPPDWNRPLKGTFVMIQPWEYGTLPEEWAEGMKNVDETWAPTSYVKKVYEDSGVSPDKIFIVPNGFDPEVFHPGIVKYQLPTEKSFVFLFLGGTIQRKGADVLLNSYLQAFTASDDVSLVFKDFGTKTSYANQTLTDEILEAQRNPNNPEIIYIDKELNAEEIAGLYAACDCLAYPYRSEGFAMPVLEAMACGKPVIVTSGGATDDFVNDSYGWVLPSKRYSIGDNVTGWKLTSDGWMLEPDSEILSALMRWVSEHPEIAKRKGAAAAKYAKENWTWDHAAAIIAERLEALQQKHP